MVVGFGWNGYQGQFNNTGSVESGTVVNSAATWACRAIGGELPTREDYKKFIKHFQLGLNGYLTEQGREEFLAAFPDMKDENGHFRWFWTSSVVPIVYNYAYHFGGHNGEFGLDDPSYDTYSVRCVQRPNTPR